MAVVSLETVRRQRARNWNSTKGVRYTDGNKKCSELPYLVSHPDPQVDESAPAALVRRIRQGDRLAETQLIERYQRPVLQLLKHRTRDEDLAMDLLQDTLLLIIRKLRSENIEQPDKLSAYIHRVAHNLVIAHFRKEKRQSTDSDTELVEVLGNTGETEFESLLKQERDQMVGKLIEELNVARDREILLRFYVWNEEKHVVCNAMDLSADQFDKVVSRARHRFKSLVQEHLGTLT